MLWTSTLTTWRALLPGGHCKGSHQHCCLFLLGPFSLPFLLSFANSGKYQEGIVDFEKALTIRHTHSNARKYLVETQMAYGDKYVCQSH